jgi:Na+/proline symporter
VQFVIKMSAVIILAVYAVRAVGGMDKLKAGVATHFGNADAALSVLPVRWSDGGIAGYAWMPLLTLSVFLSVQWWAAWYPGAEPGGGGYVAQRIFSSKTERDGVLATLFFQVAHYAIRPWPWIITALAAVLLYPNGVGPNHDHEASYVQAYVDLLPTPWRGFMMAGFAAAYMSTVGTQLNWGASYIVNDFYKRFLNRTASEKHLVSVSRWATVALFLLSILVTSGIDTVGSMWELLLALGSGTGLVLILRWYWWRVNAWSEISAMIASFVISLAAMAFVKARLPADSPLIQTYVMLITMSLSTVTWLTVTYLTKPEPDATLDAFYRKVRPGGPGWRRVSERLGFGGETIPGGALAWTNWLAGIIAVYASLFGIGKIIFGEWTSGAVLVVIAVVAFAWIARSFTGDRFAAQPLNDK